MIYCFMTPGDEPVRIFLKENPRDVYMMLMENRRAGIPIDAVAMIVGGAHELRILERDRDGGYLGDGLFKKTSGLENSILWAADSWEFKPYARVKALKAMPYKKYLASREWEIRRTIAFRKARKRCQVCNAKEGINIHHRTYENLGHELDHDLFALCRPCHGLFHENGKLAKRTRSPRRAVPAKMKAAFDRMQAYKAQEFVVPRNDLKAFFEGWIARRDCRVDDRPESPTTEHVTTLCDILANSYSLAPGETLVMPYVSTNPNGKLSCSWRNPRRTLFVDVHDPRGTLLDEWVNFADGCGDDWDWRTGWRNVVYHPDPMEVISRIDWLSNERPFPSGPRVTITP